MPNPTRLLMKKSPFPFVFGVMILISITRLAGQNQATLRDTRLHQLVSAHIEGMAYDLVITLPPDYAQTDRQYPVLYYLDAWMTTGIMNDSYFIASFTGMIEPPIMVGISFDADAPGFIYNRARDYTPTRVSPENLGETAGMIPVSGGGPAFLDFLKHELIPFVEKNYRANPQDRGILGYSLGGLFGAWVLCEDPSIFKRYGICSPSLQWDDFMILKLWEKMSPGPGKVVVFSQTEGEKPAIKSAIKKMIETASRLPDMNVNMFEVTNETHYSGVPATHMRALTMLYTKAP